MIEEKDRLREKVKALGYAGGGCDGCGGPHRFDTSVPSVAWNEVMREEEYLCLSCVVKRFAEAGKSFAAQLFGPDEVFNGGLPIEVRINGREAQMLAKLTEENNLLRARFLELQERYMKCLEVVPVK